MTAAQYYDLALSGLDAELAAIVAIREQESGAAEIEAQELIARAMRRDA